MAPTERESEPVDLILSSGFLGFSRHLGFLRCVEARGVAVGGVMGTSSGALVGALWAAGHRARWIGEELYEPVPLRSLRLSSTPWKGLFHMGNLLERLEAFLPQSFEELERPFAVGVTGPGRAHKLIRSGPLLPALEASCAVPFLLRGASVDGMWCTDGGVVDRIGYEPWASWRGRKPTWIHLIERSMGAPGTPPSGPHIQLVSSPRSGAKLWSLGPFWEQVDETQEATQRQLSAGLSGARVAQG